MAIAEIKWKLVKDTYFFDTTTCYLSEDGNHLFYVGKEKRIEVLIDDLNELVRKGCATWLELGEYEFGLDKLSKCPTTTWYGIHQMLYSLEPWGVIKESKESARKSIEESINGDCYIYYDDDDGKRNVFCDYVKGITDTRNWFYLNEYIIDAIHIFKNEKQAQKFIDEHLKYFADQDKVVIAEYPQTVSGFFESKESARKSIKEERYDVELSDYTGSIVDVDSFDKKSDAIQWAKDNGRNCYARIWDNEEGKTVKEWKVKSIKEANESVIIDGKKTNFKINDYGTFFGEKIKYMLIGKPSENEDVLADFLEENSNFEFEEYKIPYSTVYYIYNDEKSLFGVAYRHYIRLTNDEKDAKIMLAYATDKRDLYNGL